MKPRARSLITACVAVIMLGACSTASTTAGSASADWVDLCPRTSLAPWEVTNFGGQGDVSVDEHGIVLEAGSPMTGIHLLREPPKTNYELELVATRVDGSDFFCGLTFPVGEAWSTLVLGGWGGSLVGISCLDGNDAARNDTRRMIHFENGRAYRVHLVVRPSRVTVALEDELIVDYDPTAHRLTLRPEVALSRPLGIASFATTARISSVRLRELAGH
ncbi:MAG: DUF1080 domain-containing protein [Planctomycetes bacterium]|nr:DUF1080 domain-containing protein [Planctomycetota bacterium]